MQATGRTDWKRALLLSCLIVVFGLLFGCASAGGRYENVRSAEATFGQLFMGSPCHQDGCPGRCDPNSQGFFQTTATSITITTGSLCRSVNTLDKCLFTLGDGGITQITFDFSVADSCHNTIDQIEKVAFWLRREPPSGSTEVDFVESMTDPNGSEVGLWSNFDGNPIQVQIFKPEQFPWSGSITATFSGDPVAVKVQNSHNGNVAQRTLPLNDDYYFVMDTGAGQGSLDCTLTISNLQAQGSVADPSNPDNCAGLIE